MLWCSGLMNHTGPVQGNLRDEFYIAQPFKHVVRKHRTLVKSVSFRTMVDQHALRVIE